MSLTKKVFFVAIAFSFLAASANARDPSKDLFEKKLPTPTTPSKIEMYKPPLEAAPPTRGAPAWREPPLKAAPPTREEPAGRGGGDILADLSEEQRARLERNIENAYHAGNVLSEAFAHPSWIHGTVADFINEASTTHRLLEYVQVFTVETLWIYVSLICNYENIFDQLPKSDGTPRSPGDFRNALWGSTAIPAGMWGCGSVPAGRNEAEYFRSTIDQIISEVLTAARRGEQVTLMKWRVWFKYHLIESMVDLAESMSGTTSLEHLFDLQGYESGWNWNNQRWSEQAAQLRDMWENKYQAIFGRPITVEALTIYGGISGLPSEEGWMAR